MDLFSIRFVVGMACIGIHVQSRPPHRGSSRYVDQRLSAKVLERVRDHHSTLHTLNLNTLLVFWEGREYGPDEEEAAFRLGALAFPILSVSWQTLY